MLSAARLGLPAKPAQELEQAAMSQQERGRQLIERYPDKAALLLGVVFDSVVLVDGGAKRAARQETLRITRLLRQMAPHLTVG